MINGDILIVEDNTDIHQLYLEQLKIENKEGRFEGEIISAFNPKEGLVCFFEAYRKDCLPSLIILDAVFKGSHTPATGYDLAKEIRKYDRKNKCAIVMVTANSRPMDRLRINKSCVDDIIYKGAQDWPELFARIKLAYERKQNPAVESAAIAQGQGGFFHIETGKEAFYTIVFILVIIINVWFLGRNDISINSLTSSQKINELRIDDTREDLASHGLLNKNKEK